MGVSITDTEKSCGNLSRPCANCGMHRHFAVLNCCSNFNKYVKGFWMKSGSSRRGWLYPFVMSSILIANAVAQQSPNPSQSIAPADLPAGQPVSQAAQSASGTGAQKNDEAKDSSDQSTLV